MRLAALHILCVEDLPLAESLYRGDIVENEVPIGGNRKNENSPVAKAVHSTGKSQQDIASKAGVHPSTISRYKRSKDPERGRKPSFATLKRLTRAVGAKASSLFPELGA
jgi:hypothetical protein